MYGEVQTKRWNRPKVVQSLKELEKIPTRRNKRICKLQKEKDTVINSFTFIVYFNTMIIYKYLAIKFGRDLVTLMCDGNVMVENLGGGG